MASKVVDKIDPFQNKALIKSRKQKRSQGSSHYRSPGTSELQALPQLKGIDFQLVLNGYRQSHHNILTILLKWDPCSSTSSTTNRKLALTRTADSNQCTREDYCLFFADFCKIYGKCNCRINMVTFCYCVTHAKCQQYAGMIPLNGIAKLIVTLTRLLKMRWIADFILESTYVSTLAMERSRCFHSFAAMVSLTVLQFFSYGTVKMFVSVHR